MSCHPERGRGKLPLEGGGCSRAEQIPHPCHSERAGRGPRHARFSRAGVPLAREESRFSIYSVPADSFRLCPIRLLSIILVLLCALPLFATDASSPDILARTRAQLGNFLKLFSEVRCNEEVSQTKLMKNGKVELQENSTFDYLVIAQQTGTDVTLQESRLAQHASAQKPNDPLLVTNGFATLLLIFHPEYEDSFEFSPPSPDVLEGQTVAKVQFRHIPNKPSTTELVLRGREYPLDLVGTAWIDPASGSIMRIQAELAKPMDDIGLRLLRTDVEYAPVSFRDVDKSLRLPALATVEVETARQHWRNVHRFSGYQHFDVSVEENVKAEK